MSGSWACFPLLLEVWQPGLRASWAGGLGKRAAEAWARVIPLLWSCPELSSCPWSLPELCHSFAAAMPEPDPDPPPASWCPAWPQPISMEVLDALGCGCQKRYELKSASISWKPLTEKEGDVFCRKDTLLLIFLILSEFLPSMKKSFWQKILFQLSLQALSRCICSSILVQIKSLLLKQNLLTTPT